jgi:threonine synthase
MRGKKGVRVFMTSPNGRMSPFQQAQMFSLQDANIHNLALEGVFDDCQDIVKAVSNDLDFKRKYRIGTVNSINWARLVAQVVYYFAGYFQATRSNDQRVSFTVPSGNFGNICAGHVARMMGLPIARLVATNENDVLDGSSAPGSMRARQQGHLRDLQPPRWTSPRRATSSASCSTCWAATAPGCATCSARSCPPRAASTCPDALARARDQYGFASGKSTRRPAGDHPRHLGTLRDHDRHPHRRWPEGRASTCSRAFR